MKIPFIAHVAALGAASLLLFGVLIPGCADAPGGAADTRAVGPTSALGGGTVASYSVSDAAGSLQAIGVAFSAAALEQPPTAPSDGNHCVDLNEDGKYELMDECARWHEFVLPLPSDASSRADLPFKWALVNWNPHGHIPPGIMHADFQDVGAVAPAMGNHLVDPTAPEFHGTPFTRTWIYGAYAGRVTFYEEMVTLDYLKSQPDACFPIKPTPAVELSGYYPTQSCVRYSGAKAEYTVSLEGFQFREAGAGT